ncbi:hypothetical protein V3C99_017583, partial [Haemonchus contortus]
ADIVGVCETRRARAVPAKWTSGEEILLGGGADSVSRTGGVGFTIKANMARMLFLAISSPHELRF